MVTETQAVSLEPRRRRATLRRLGRLAVRGGLAVLLLTLMIFGLLCVWPMHREAYLHPPVSGELQDAQGRMLFVFLNEDAQWCFERRLDQISPYLAQATVAAEDQRFDHHPGVDPVAVLRACGQNARAGGVVSGASTLTMQVVKMHLGLGSGLGDKLRQAWGALRLEMLASKDQILQAYLNRAPYGLNLVGAEAAAQRFFGKTCAELTAAQAALLAGLPKSPTNYNPLAHPAAARLRRGYVLGRMLALGYLSQDQYDRAMAEPLGTQWHAFPQLAPHLAARLSSVIRAQGAWVSSLDREDQQRTQALLARGMEAYEGSVDNAAALVVQTQTGRVLAHAGSVDFFDPARGGQFDASRALRSPGSTLKPFTYALAFERQLLYPCETLLDGTVDYGLYNPANMDRTFHGLVSAGQALRRSLNTPAVTVLGRLGVGELYGFLKSLGFATLTRPPEHYGLGLTLGSCEVRLEDLARAYLMLANLGEIRPLCFGLISEDPVQAPRRALSRGSCLSLYDCLQQPLPGETVREDGLHSLPRVCWKTGTSWGKRDAWCVVFNRHYLVAVWTGNNDGRSSPDLVGARLALPLAGRLFRSLPPLAEDPWPSPGGDLRPVKICALSGLPAAEWCPHTTQVWLPASQLLARKCDMHYPATAGLEPQAQGSIQRLERWPGSAKGWDLAHITSVKPTLQVSLERSQALAIRCPVQGAQYVMTGEQDLDRLLLSASLDDASPLHWYLDDRFLGTAHPGSPCSLPLTAGEHKLVCMTPQGQVQQIAFEVLDE